MSNGTEDRFTVDSSNGNTVVKGILSVEGATGVDGDFDVATNKFTVDSSNGNTAIAGTLAVSGATGIDGDFDINTNKFTVASSTGNTAIAGTLGVSGVTTLTSSSTDDATLKIDNTGNGHAMSISLTNTLASGQAALEVDVSDKQADAENSPAISVNLKGESNVPATGLLGNNGICSNHGSVIMSTHGGTGIGIQCESSSYGNIICTSSRARFIDTQKTDSSTPGLRPIDIGTNSIVKGEVDNDAADTAPVTEGILTLQTGDTNIAINDKLGVINFQAPDEGNGGDAILVAAGIEAVSEGDFSSSNNATKLSFKTASSAAAAETMSLSSGGDLTVTGTAHAVSFNSSSDLRLKTNIIEIDNCLNRVKKIRGVYFDWVENNEPDCGVIAQEIEKVLPLVVRDDRSGFKTVDYSRLTTILIQACKEQQSIIEKQQKQIDTLGQKVDQYKNDVDSLKLEFMKLRRQRK